MTEQYVSREVIEEAILLSATCKLGNVVQIYADKEGGWCLESTSKAQLKTTTGEHVRPEMIVKAPLLKDFGDLAELSEAADELEEELNRYWGDRPHQ